MSLAPQGMSEKIEQAILLFESPVLSEWIDYNGHMNDACYVIAFSQAVDGFMSFIDLNESFREQYSVSIYTLQSMVSYLQEVSEGENILIKGQLLESDSKKLRLFLTMYHAETHDKLATMETLLLHMDMKQHKASPFLPHTLSLVKQVQTAHNELEKPNNAGKPISLKRI